MDYQKSWRDQKNKNHPPKKRSGGKKTLKKFNLSKKKILKAGLVLFLVFIIFCVAAFSWFSRGLPEPGQLMERQVAQSTKIYDRSGEHILYDIHGEEQRTLIKLEDIPDHVKWAAIAVEDKNFYEHKGVSLWGILRGVVWQKIRGKRVQGGSTLTQQFVKNAILTSERKISRKIKEWILAYKMEKSFSKDQILELYLNEIPYGSTAYGVEAASRRYFNKGVKDITIAEAAILAALPQAPTYYSPYGSHKDALIARQQTVINLMADQGYISEEQAQEAREQELEFAEPAANITAPHFVMYVKELLTEKYGEKMVEQGGLKIYTTLDLYKQEIAEEVVEKYGEKNEENYEATNASLVSIDPKTGQILAMVGSRDYFNDDIDGQVNVAISKRQPGSSLKPLVYASMFEKGYTPNTVLYDVVTNFSNDKANPYEPKNYDLKQHGPVSVRKALAGSLNTTAVKAVYLAGIDNVLKNAEALGYSTLGPQDAERVGFSLVLGGGEVKLLDHTNAYSAFAREGKIRPASSILKIEDANGDILEEWEEKDPKQVLDENVAKMINSVLSDNGARAYAFGTSNWLTLGSRPVAAKTGTTNDYHDAWTIGYTPSIVTGVWVGNSDNAAMKRGASGGTVAAPIWHDYMQKVLGDTPIEQFKSPEIKETGKAIIDGQVGASKVKIDSSTGLLATEFTPENLVEEVMFTQHHSILYYVDKDDPLGDIPQNPGKDPQFHLWEERVQLWAEEELKNSTSTAITSSSTAPTEYDNVHIPENIPELEIIEPVNNKTITSPYLTVKLKATAKRGVAKVNYYLDGTLFVQRGGYFFNLNEYPINYIDNGYHNLRVEVCDDVYNCTSKSVEFNLSSSEAGVFEEFNIDWISPASGLAVTDIDFPVNIQLKTINPEQISKIELTAIKDGGLSVLTTIAPIESEYINWSWDDPPTSGTYSLTAKAYSWNNQIKNTESVSMVINNIE
ncbi:PBP1A family penicillin-binding protein [Candidatus Falkowbacteria bacterium]|nr:PBP1A family penicillin-binding protein [Candidatus Falkowbacteria bacterium]